MKLLLSFLTLLLLCSCVTYVDSYDAPWKFTELRPPILIVSKTLKIHSQLRHGEIACYTNTEILFLDSKWRFMSIDSLMFSEEFNSLRVGDVINPNNTNKVYNILDNKIVNTN